MPVVDSEGLYDTIYDRAWETAMRRIDRIVSARIAREYRAVIEALREGWDILRPLAQHAGQVTWDLQSDDPAQAIAWVANADVCDAFRGVVWECRDSIPARSGFERRPTIANAVEKCREIRAHLRVLRLATESPAFSPELRDLVMEAHEAFGAWVERLDGLVRPVAEREERVVCDGARPPKVRAA